MACDLGSGDFVLWYEEEDDSFHLLLFPHDDSGTPRTDLAAQFEVRRGAGVSAATIDSSLRDQRLVGARARARSS